MNKEQELRRCPFCNATPHKGATKVQHDQLHGDSFQRYRIWCPHGCANIERVNEEQAREAWNGSDLPDDKAAWQWSDPSGKWYTVDTAFATLEEQEELARRVAGQHEGRVRPLFARRSSDEQAEVAGLTEALAVAEAEHERAKRDGHGDVACYAVRNVIQAIRLRLAAPPAVAAGGVTVDPDLLSKQSTIEPDVAAVVYADRSKLYSDFSGGVTEEMVDLAWRRLNGAKYITPDDVRAALTAALREGDHGN